MNFYDDMTDIKQRQSWKDTLVSAAIMLAIYASVSNIADHVFGIPAYLVTFALISCIEIYNIFGYLTRSWDQNKIAIANVVHADKSDAIADLVLLMVIAYLAPFYMLVIMSLLMGANWLIYGKCKRAMFREHGRPLGY
ncbi:hypothetical protein GR11A_00234 [Vibrio phage vB_VcorM_GR11A]|nr:hypothetical protein GR11A_00234 [Vibrio phage vB_VcorM_GR11A]